MAKPLKALQEVLNNLFTKNVTHLYPFVGKKVDERYRAKIKFLPENCIGCQLCVRNCPANAIKIVQTNPEVKPALGPDGKPMPVKREFKAFIDLGRCIFCAQCVDSCPKAAVVSTQEYELADFDRKSLIDEFKNPHETAAKEEEK